MNNEYLNNKYKNAPNLEVEYMSACKVGDLEAVKYLLMNKNVNIHTDDGNGYLWACQQGHLDVVEYLTSSPDLKEHIDIEIKYNEGIYLAVTNNKLNIINYLLTSKKLKKNIDIHFNNDKIFIKSCLNGNLEIVKYLLTSPDLKDHIDFNNTETILNGFLKAFDNDKESVINFLIFDMNLRKNETIQDYFNTFKVRNKRLEQIDKFEKWFLLNELNNELSINEKIKTNRIKI